MSKRKSICRAMIWKIWEYIGKVTYVVTYPGIWLVIKSTPPRARIIVICDNKVLLTKDWLGLGSWSIPGGGLHRNEASRIGAVRELREETGIVITTKDLHYLGSYQFDGSTDGKQLVCYWTELSSFPEIVKQRIEILDYCWVELSELQNLDVQSASKQIVDTFRVSHNLVH
jgi:8-oxo-dGTP pyrophosphatase MutT (NUDIX family)